MKRGSVNHTFAGTRLLLERYHTKPEDYADVVSEILALAVGAHHGWFDCVDEQHKNGFQYRLDKEDIGYEEAIDRFFRLCASPKELDQRFEKARQEMAPLLERICGMTGPEASDDRYDEETAFYSGLLARLLLSAVMEGDRRDTAEFMNAAQFPQKRTVAALTQLWGNCLERVEDKIDRFPRESEIDRARRAISDQCRSAAQQPSGVFRLNVPTGGGKTLASLRYALAHAQKHGKRRIIFTSPLLSILEQNAAVIRDYVQDDSMILEHHSNLVQTEENPEQLDERELLLENWDAPMIITTLVQLLNILFSGKTTAIRRFHALCNSVIVIDEVQTVPSKMLSLFSLAMNFLSEVCGATIILCSATQPCMEQIEHPLHTPIPELVPYDSAIWDVFRRTDIQYVGELSLEGITCMALELLEEKDSLLIVCNKKGEAESLFHRLEKTDADVYQLSAAMCVAHRRDTLDRLRASLNRKDGGKTICIATQVIEAGVDISFACVIRFAAGMDSVVQAAGRCNRSAEAGSGILAPVYLVLCQNESLGRLPDIQAGKDATLELLSEFAQHPEQYLRSLDSDESIRYYYRALYRRMRRGHHDYLVAKKPYTLFSLLTRNEQLTDDSPQSAAFYFRQAFRTAGTLFEVFEQSTETVIVPYGKGEELIANLCSARAKQNLAYVKSQLEQAKPYTVSLYQYQIENLKRKDALVLLCGGVMALNGHYHHDTGFSMDEEEFKFLEV